jgi:hypothetical protein
MSMEFGWWNTDPGLGKFQVKAVVQRGRVSWRRKQGHFSLWESLNPEPTDWERLVSEASRRVPRRLISPKQFEEIRLLCERR